MWRLYYFCYCMSLRTGSILAAVFTFMNVFHSAFFIVLLITGDPKARHLGFDFTPECTHDSLCRTRIFLSVIQGILDFIAAVCLSFGIVKHEYKLVSIWAINILIHIVFLILSLFMAFMLATVGVLTFYTISRLIALPIWCYLWITVWSFYIKLKDSSLEVIRN
uniref:Uncharacterized protein n=1 Tax=Strigamia maritima TaxID=126957 RepID=T1IHE9_STRMM